MKQAPRGLYRRPIFLASPGREGSQPGNSPEWVGSASQTGTPQSHPPPFLAQKGHPCPFFINLLCCVGPGGQHPSPPPIIFHKQLKGLRLWGAYCILGYNPVCIVSFMLRTQTPVELIFFLLLFFFKNLSSFVQSSGSFGPSTGMPLKASLSPGLGGLLGSPPWWGVAGVRLRKASWCRDGSELGRGSGAGRCGMKAPPAGVWASNCLLLGRGGNGICPVAGGGLTRSDRQSDSPALSFMGYLKDFQRRDSCLT